MSALVKWWEELEADDRFIVVIVAMICASIVTIIQPAVAIVAVFFAGMRYTIHADNHTVDKYLNAMKPKGERK